MSRILWYTKGRGYSDKMKALLDMYQRKCGINPADIFYVSIHTKVSNPTIMQGNGKLIVPPPKQQEIKKVMREQVATLKPKIIVVNDRATLGAVTGGNTSLYLCRGSCYFLDDIPVLVLDDPDSINSQKDGSWIFINDLQKVWRWQHDKQRKQPKFIYEVCRTVADARRARDYLDSCFCIGEDIETKGGFITCVGFTGLALDGTIKTFVIPFFNPHRPGGAHWPDVDTEVEVWGIVRDINTNGAIKIFQNGSYDNSYFIKYHSPVANWFLDTYHIFHSIWCETERKLNFISSICLDYNRYWKDESKGSKEDSFGRTAEQLERYWRYNALDCYNMFLSCRVLLSILLSASNNWAFRNYVEEFMAQVGPAFNGSMRGMKLDGERQRIVLKNYQKQADAALEKVKRLADDPNFNPNSSPQFAHLLYDIFGMEPTKKKGKKGQDLDRTTDEKILKLLVLQHPIFEYIADAVWAVKKPLNQISKYGDGLGYQGRSLYSLNAGGTETSRYACKEHMYWCGTNAQNIPRPIRGMFRADPGYVFFEADYSQSDGWFIAHEAQELNMIRTFTSGRDTHCIHASHFFKQPEELILQKVKEKDPFYAHEVTGIRALTKRIVHGSNFRMEGFTLYMTMGRKAAIAAAEALNYSHPIIDRRTGKVVGALRPHEMTENQLVEFCQKYLLDSYHVMYPRLRNDPKNWFDEIVENAVKNRNKATTAFGFTRLFFGDISENKAIQRQLSAFFGQGGTAGNINRSLKEYWYESGLDGNGMYFLTQTHDSILTLVQENRLDLCEKLLTIMKKPCTINERTFSVPVDAKIGRSWEGSMIKYKSGISLTEIDEAEKKYAATFEATAKELDEEFLAAA